MQSTLRSHDTTGALDDWTDADWTGVCTFDSLEPLWAEAALIDGVQVALVVLPDGSLYAVSNQDPVTGSFVMSRGIIGSRGDRPTLASPLHKQVYDLETGECFTSADYALRTFPVRVEHGIVQVQVRQRVDMPNGQDVAANMAVGGAVDVAVEFAAA